MPDAAVAKEKKTDAKGMREGRRDESGTRGSSGSPR